MGITESPKATKTEMQIWKCIDMQGGADKNRTG